MISKVIKKGEKSYLELPAGLNGTEELELLHLKDNFYLLSPANPKEKKETVPTFEEELLVVSKLMTLKFAERTPSKVDSILSEKEKNALNSLIKKKHIWVFHGDKYKKEGVYNISNKLFEVWKENRASVTNSSFFSMLEKEGYVIIPESNEAKIFSDQLKEQMVAGSILGVRAFDGKYYITTKDYYNKTREKIEKKINDSMSVLQIAELCQIPKDGCLVVLTLMLEEGEAIEKRKGIFSII